MSENVDIRDFARLHSIIQNDSTNTTYKYALLRATIEACTGYFHFAETIGDDIELPIGILVEKWLTYYYPIIAHEDFIPQQAGESVKQKSGVRIAFRGIFLEIIEYYQKIGGFAQFYDDLKRGKFPSDINQKMIELIRLIRSTIKDQPMRYLGKSYTKEEYSIYKSLKKSPSIRKDHVISRDYLFSNLGFFTIPVGMSSVFRLVGGLISGELSLIYKWAQFSSQHDKQNRISTEKMLDLLQTYEEDPRDVQVVRKYYLRLLEAKEKLICTWSGHEIRYSSELDIDHIIPFSISKNNDFWNLVPTLSSVNNAKSDKILSRTLLEKRKNQLFKCWGYLRKLNQRRFDNGLKLGLVGNQKGEWGEVREIAHRNLVKRCYYLIEVLSYRVYE
ncbi:MAG: CRISPR-associated endonuclease Cas9 [Candidatus Heimdallarchaeota archaeon LC_2]|nr:MAG: CRISPR-associated endonuclease Cas9 [Candidatus Heimdallarchaeota archaeon LC_2]